jgi:outer membrane protein TolC
MRHQITRVPRAVAALALAVCLAATANIQVAAQAPGTRRLTLEDAVRLALEENLGIRIERLSPELQDLVVADARSSWVPTLSSGLSGDRANTPSTNAFSGGQTSIIDTSVSSSVGLGQTLPTGGSYASIRR